jgi:hypothetical protein
MYRIVTQLQLQMRHLVCKNEIWQCIWFGLNVKSQLQAMHEESAMPRDPHLGLGLIMGYKGGKEGGRDWSRKPR